MNTKRLRDLHQELVDAFIEEVDEDSEREGHLVAAWSDASRADRTAQSFPEWLEEYAAQIAAAWVVTAVFVRFLEDNGLIEADYIAGPTSEARDRADETLRWFRREHSTASETDYLQWVFEELAELEAGGVFREDRNPLYRWRLPADAGRRLLEGLSETDPDTGEVELSFEADPRTGSDPTPSGEGSASTAARDQGAAPQGVAGGYSEEASTPSSGRAAAGTESRGVVITPRNTRFLGDLYEDLAKSAGLKDKYGLVQTPEFVCDFILEYTLDEAIDELGAAEVRMIDPACGSGHFLLDGFWRILEALEREEPDWSHARRVREALDSVHGVDLQAFAVSIARFRLLAAALEALSANGRAVRLDDAPELPLNVGAGDSLIHGDFHPRFETDCTDEQAQKPLDAYRWDDRYSPEDATLLTGAQNDPENGEGILTRRYDVVVGNPPYVTVKDDAQGDAYRRFYESCYYSYSLVCPFFERFFDLATGPLMGEEDDTAQESLAASDDERDRRPGWVGMIVGNNFMKRRFGQKLIEEIVPNCDLTHVVDTSGAYIPGHGTPTVTLLGRNRQPATDEVHAAMGIRGEPDVPSDPVEGRVWSSIRDHVSDEFYEDDFVTIDDLPRQLFHEHPWTLEGGGAMKLKAQVESQAEERLSRLVTAVGRVFMTNADQVYLGDTKAQFQRRGINKKRIRKTGVGEDVRNWRTAPSKHVLFPYDSDLQLIPEDFREPIFRYLWRFRDQLWLRHEIGGTHLELGMTWYEWSRLQKKRLAAAFVLPHSEIATHNHFALHRGANLFKRTAPVIKLSDGADEEDHLELLGPLNSSAGCFWMKQVFQAKGGDKLGDGARRAVEGWEDRYQRDGTKMKKFPLPADRPVELPRRLDALGQRLADARPGVLAEQGVPTAENLDAARDVRDHLLRRMIPLQEELDWRMYRAYGLCDDAPLAEDYMPDRVSESFSESGLPDAELGERPFEIKLAREMERGEVETSWFERHGSEPRTDVPERWPEWYRELVQARIECIDEERFVELIEAPEFKRRWNLDDWEKLEKNALEDWLARRLESPRYVPQSHMTTAGLEDEDETFREPDADPELVELRHFVEAAMADDAFRTVGARYTGDPNFDVEGLVRELLEDHSVPFLPAQRYEDSGRRRRREWEEAWRKQDLEDAIDALIADDEAGDGLDPDYGEDAVAPERGQYVAADFDDIPELADARRDAPISEDRAERLKDDLVGEIDRPPKYRKTDYQSGTVYALHGKLDVPTERFHRYPGCGAEGGDLYSWAGLDHADRAKALASRYFEAKESGWTDDEDRRRRLAEMLAGVDDLLFWVRKWHPEPEPTTGEPLADFLESTLQAERNDLGISPDELEAIRLGTFGE